MKQLNYFGLALRGLSMAGKLLLLVMISKVSSLEDLGVYGIFVSTIVLLNYAQGLEFHSYTGRQILGQSKRPRSDFVGNQLMVHMLTYVVILPLALVIFWGEILSWELLFVFYWVAVVTHLGQEAQRLLIVLSRINRAYLTSFLVHGVWTYIAVVYLYFQQDTSNLKMIFVFWAASGTLGSILGAYFLRSENCLTLSMFRLDKNWILNGLSISYKFFLAAMAYKIIELSDRYFIQHFHGDAMVGIYTLFSSVANISQEIVYTGIVVLIFPAMLLSFNNKRYAAYQKHRRKLNRSVVISSLAILVLLLISMYGLLIIIDRTIFIENFAVFILLAGSATVVNLSLIPNYVLYVHGRDNVIMWSVLTGMCLNVVLNICLIPSYGISGAAMATLLSFVLVSLIKVRFAADLK